MKSKNYYKTFLGILTKEGKKYKSKKILDESLVNVNLKTGKKISDILIKIIQSSTILVEARRRRVGRQFYIVPFPVKSWRRRFLSIKNLVTSVENDRNRIPFSQKLSNEITNIAMGRETKTVLENRKKIRQIIVNRSNSHFRW